MKKYILALTGLLMALAVNADVTIDNITYVLDESNLEARVKTSLSGASFADNKVTIPDTVTNNEKKYVVVGIESFSNKGAKDEMVLPKTVTYIKSVKAGIVTLNVPASVTSITDMTESADLQDFKVDESNATYCDVDGVLYSKDKKILVNMPFGRNGQANLGYTIPDGTEKIGETAFYKMTNLATIVLPKGLTSIGDNAFNGCTSLKNFTIPSGLKTIGWQSFMDCTSLQTLIFPEGMEEIGTSAFNSCTRLTTVKFGEGLKTIKSYAFASCYALSYVDFANSIETIEDRAFWRTQLNKVVLPENLQSLGWQSFIWARNNDDDYKKHLQSIVIPSKVTGIGEYAFGGYRYYDNHINNMTAEFFTVDTIYVHMAPYTVPANAFGTLTTTTLVVPKGMRDIYSTTDGWRNIPNVIEGDWEPAYDKSPFVKGDDAIEEGMSITQDGITYRLYAKEARQAHLFSELKDYSSDIINLPEQIYYRANNYTVTGVEKFKSNRVVDLILPNTVTSIQTIKSGVKTLNVSAGVTSITDMHESTDLQDFKVDEGNITYSEIDGVLYSKDKKTLWFMPYGRRTQENMSVTIPEGVETIGSYAFYKMTNITRVQTNAELQLIGDNAFQGCTSISSLTLTKGLKKIGAYNFGGCTGLSRIIFPEGLEEIGNNAFDGCTNLTKISFGEGLKSIRTYAFASCYALTTVDFANSIETIGDRAFWRTQLNKVVLPENLQSLGWQSFIWARNNDDDYKKHLQSIVIPSKVTGIGEYAFGGYRYYDNHINNMTAEFFTVDTIYTCITEPFIINSNAFGNITNTVLMVPRGTKEEYLLWNGWKDFGDRIEEWDAPSPSDKICKAPVITRDKDTLRVTSETEGASIYYTMDGNDPTINDLLYDNSRPIELKENCTVKAIAIKEDLENSTITTFKVNWFTVADVKIEWEGLQVKMSTETEGAVIRYTLDGSDPTEKSTAYQNVPLSFGENCTIKAIGMKKNWNSSRVTSFDVDLPSITCATPTFRRSGKSLVIETATVDAMIYYTLDDTEPTATSLKYDMNNPIVPTENCTVRAVVMKDGYRNSDVGEYKVDWFAAADVVIEIVNLQVEMSSATEGAVIRYTIDGTEPTEQSAIYRNPLSLPDGTVVKAFAMKENLSNSQTTTYTVDYKPVTCYAPEIRVLDNQMIIGTSTIGGAIYYTLDGSIPTKQSTLYVTPVTLTQNCVVKAIVVKDGFFDSSVVTYDASSLFKVHEPTFIVNGTVLTINCDSEGSDIYYGIGENVEPTIRYQSPVTLVDNRPVRAIAKKEGYKDSEIAVFTHSKITCEPATLDKYDGRNFTLNVPDGATVYYTVDGTNPTTESEKYTGRTALTGICTIKTLAVSLWKNNSEIKSIDVTYFSDDESATITEAGQLQQSMEWQGANAMKSLKVSGPLNATDLTYIKTEMTSLEHLNMEDVTVSDNTLPAEAFAGMQSLVSFTSPKNITTAGERILANCPKLAAVVWNPAVKLPNNTFGDATNPNMLVYVVNAAFAPSNAHNKIVNGSATTILLSDAEGYADFYCPKPFTAKKVSYTHNYSMETGYEESKGWETIALPFTVQKINHESKGELMTFKQFEEAGSPEDGRPFWLRTLTDNGFEDASTIEAYIPYIISMPNNKEYASRYNIVGNVTFSSENVEIGVTTPVTKSKSDVFFIPCFQKKDASSKVWPINIKQEYEGQPAGSVFVPELREAKPFEAYATMEVSNARMITISGLYNGVTDIEHILYDRSHEMKDETVKVYTVSGVLLKTGKRSEVMKQLPTGMYIINGEKIVIE